MFTHYFTPQINYTQIDNVFRLCNRIEPSAALFWALRVVFPHLLQQVTQVAGPASPRPQQLYWHGTVQLGSVRFNLRVKTRILLYIIYLCFTYSPPNSQRGIQIISPCKQRRQFALASCFHPYSMPESQFCWLLLVSNTSL